MTRLITSFPAQTVVVTPENVEQKVRAWIDKFGISVRTIQADDNSVFSLEIIGHDGKPLQILQPRKLSSYLVVSGVVSVSPEHIAILKNLTEEEKSKILEQVGAEVAKTRMPMAIAIGGSERMALEIDRRIPIDANLKEASFMESIDDVSLGVSVMRQAFREALLSSPKSMSLGK
jgi:hypothetical protein